MDNNKLDETVKKTLRNYEVPFNENDWVQMESMLDVAPKQNPLRRSYSPSILLYALIIVGAAFLLYTVVTPLIVNTKTPERKPVETKSVIAVPALPPLKKVVQAPVKTVTTPSVTTTPAITSTKKDVKTTEKNTVEKQTVEKKVIENKNSKAITLSSQENKAKLFKKTLEKNKNAAKQELKPEVKQEENDTVHIDDGNDSNRNRQVPKISNNPALGNAVDTFKNGQAKKASEKETRKSRRDKKTTVNDTLSKNPPSN